jgi:hypothetical protein
MAVNNRGRRAAGTKEIGNLFPDGAPATSVPWDVAGRRKDRMPYDQSKVTEALSNPDHPVQGVDPTTLTATQPSITRAGVAHYSSGATEQYSEGGAGNVHPVVYARDDGTNLILSGHHRAATALLNGDQFQAKVVRGGHGEPK